MALADLATSLMRVATMTDLWPGGVNGQPLPGDLEESTCVIGPKGQCDAAVAATAAVIGPNMFNFVCLFLFLATWITFGGAWYWLYRKWKHGMAVMEREQYHLAVQIAEFDTAYTNYNGRLMQAEFGLGETARDLEFLQGYASSIHYGLVEVGGCRSELTTDQNGHMYSTERGKFKSFHVMGGDRYMRLVSQHSTGIHAATDNTDQQVLGAVNMEVDQLRTRPMSMAGNMS